MTALDLSMLTTACAPGGASVLTSITELVPAAGAFAGIAPARYLRGRNATYAYDCLLYTSPSPRD